VIGILDKYVTREFLKVFFGTFFLLTGVGIISKVMEQIQRLMDYSGPAIEILRYLGYILPYIMMIVAAPSLMFAVSFTVSQFSKNKELNVMQAAGRSLKRFLIPFILFSFSFSVFLFFFNEYLAYPSFLKSFNQIQVIVDNKHYTRKRNNFDFQGKSGNRFYHAGEYHVQSNTIISFYMIETDSNLRTRRTIEAEVVHPAPGNWVIENGIETLFNTDGTLASRKKFKELNENFEEGPDYFQKVALDFEEMSIFELQKEIELRKKKGDQYLGHLVELYWHYSFPFVCFFIVFIAGIMGSMVRKGAMSLSIALSTLITLVYYLLMFLGKAFAVKGVLPPMFGAWFANITFTLLSIILLYRFKN